MEVLETVFADRIDDELRHILDQLDEAGVRLEIDDFGTGHASFLGLLSLKPSRLKIARELVAPLGESPTHATLIRSICDIARSLKVGVTAEGVETEAQLDLLSECGCDRLQGYLFARPAPSEALVETLLEWRGRAPDQEAAGPASPTIWRRSSDALASSEPDRAHRLDERLGARMRIIGSRTAAPPRASRRYGARRCGRRRGQASCA